MVRTQHRSDAKLTYTKHGKLLTWRGITIEDPANIVSVEQMYAQLEMTIIELEGNDE